MPDYCNPNNWHPAANAFPLLPKSDPERFSELVSNIKENGLLEPIVLYEDKVLDGRNRVLACREAGIEPEFETFILNGVGPVQWIAAKHTRRDLDASQRAAAALALLPLLEKEAKERQWKGVTLGQDCPKGKAREAAAGLTGASDGYVRDAKRIVEKGASMLERMRDGEITIQEAKRELGFKQILAAVNSDESYEWSASSTWRVWTGLFTLSSSVSTSTGKTAPSSFLHKRLDITLQTKSSTFYDFDI